ncbi:MAG: glycoside hydrolase family 2 [Duncaniella sp.]|nr:glycoside hydrolase family 2 [Duncaniella sp.]
MNRNLLYCALVITSVTADAQYLNRTLINDGWRMQDVAEVVKGGPAKGWVMQNSARVAQEGKYISRPDYDAEGWYTATVPGTVLTTLVNEGVYPEPLYGENNRPDVIPEYLNQTQWWYRNAVTIPADFAGKRIWLNFDGINYQAEVWVNGRNVGPIKGAFIRKNFDITDMVKPGEEAVVAVKITPQPHTGVPSEHTMGTVCGPCGGVGRLDGPTFGCSSGWDFMSGVRDRNSGIWQDVWISATGDVCVKDPRVTTRVNLPDTTAAEIMVEATVQNTSASPRRGTVKGNIGDIRFEKFVEVGPYRTATVDFTPEEFAQLRITAPKLWWPNGMGEQNLYDLHLTFEHEDGSVSDERDVTFGIRQIDYFADGPDKLALAVNGKRLYCKGGNWALEEALKRIDPKRLEAQVRMHRDANLNMIRLWGGQAASKTFYDLCDRYGLLVWDEFWQFNSADPIDHDLYMANVRDKILTYRNHPSLVIWCARNEAAPPKYLTDDVRYALIELDPERHYQPNSGGGLGCNSGGPYDWLPPHDFYRFRERNFNNAETFKTEIGSHSIPTIESIQGMMPEEDWDGITDAWAEHNFGSGGGRKLIRTMASRYGKAVNLPDFVRKAQMMSHETFKAIFEGRMAEMHAPMEGILLWMSVPTQPSFVWQMMHYDLEPNSSMFAVKSACEPLHIQLNDNGGVIQVVNHNNAPRALTAKCRVYGLDGKLIGEKSFDVTARPDATTPVGTMEWIYPLESTHLVKLELADADGKRVSDNFYWKGASSEPDNLTALDAMPVVKIKAKGSVRKADGKTYVDLTLHNPAKVPALMTHLQLRRSKSLGRVLPAFYRDNYISLLPGEKRSVTIEADDSDLDGENPLVYVDGWNVDVVPTTLVKPNLNARTDSRERGEFTFKPRETVARESVKMNCAGYGYDGFESDPGFLDAPIGYVVEDVYTEGVEDAAPMSVYQSVRWGASRYPNLMARKGRYKVRLHFAEQDRNTPVGHRCFDVLINGRPVIENLDVMAETGHCLKALVKTVDGVECDENGVITIETRGRKGSPQLSGYEILPEI